MSQVPGVAGVDVAAGEESEDEMSYANERDSSGLARALRDIPVRDLLGRSPDEAFRDIVHMRGAQTAATTRGDFYVYECNRTGRDFEDVSLVDALRKLGFVTIARSRRSRSMVHLSGKGFVSVRDVSSDVRAENTIDVDFSGILPCKKRVVGEMVADDHDIFEAANFVDAIEPHTGRLRILERTQSGLSTRNTSFNIARPLVRENYPDAVLRAFDQTVYMLRADDPRARLSIFEGPWGSGKTYILRGLVHEAPKARYLHISAELVRELDGPDFISALRDMKDEDRRVEGPTALLIEDADEVLQKRNDGNRSAVRSLLNLTDGLISRELDIRVVATTNKTGLQIDDAIRREGRCAVYETVPKLKPDHARAVFARLVGLSVDEAPPCEHQMTLAEVYAEAEKWEAGG